MVIVATVLFWIGVELTKRIKWALPYGWAEPGMVQIAVEMDVDLIVMSTRGRTGLERAYLGSTAERVVRHAACPVLIVRKR